MNILVILKNLKKYLYLIGNIIEYNIIIYFFIN